MLTRLAWEIGGARRVRLSGRRAVRAVPALRRARADAGAARRLRAAQPGRRDAAVRAAAGGDGGGHGDPERRRPSGRRAQGGDSGRRAAGSRRLLRRHRHVAAARTRCCRSAGGGWAVVARIAVIRLGVAAGLRVVRHRSARPARYAVDRPDFAGRHHARPRGGARDGVSRPGASVCRRCWWRSSPSTNWSGRRCSASAWRAPARSTRSARRPLIVVSNREPYLHNYDDARRASRSHPATGGVAVALDALMRERGGIWIAHGDGTADRAVVDAGDKRARAARCAVVRAAPSVARAGAVAGLLRRVRQRRAVAALPSGRRAAAVPQRGLDGVSGGQRRSSRPPSTRSCRRDRHAGVHPGLPPRAGRAATARAAAAGAHRAVLAHPVAVSGSAAHLPVAPRDSRRDCWPTTCWRSSSSAIAAISCSRSRRSSTPTIEADGETVRCDGRVTTVDRGADRRRLRSHSGEWRAIRRSIGEQAAAAPSSSICEPSMIGLGVDRLDYTKGIPERLEALEPRLHAPARSCAAG